MTPIYTFGIQLIQALQTLSPMLDGVMKFFSFMGTVEFYMVFIPLLYWVVDAQLGIRIFMVLLLTDILGASFKLAFHQPRPYWVGDVKPLATETSYGFPSSHSSDSLAVWGLLAYRVKKGWLWACAVSIILLIAFSRMYLGVHFPTDALGGWLIGLVVFFLFARFEGRVVAWFKQRSESGQIWIAFFISIIMVLVGWLILRLIAPYSDPADWTQYASEARSITQHITLAGAFFGSAAGFVLMWNHARFNAQGPAGLRIIRFLLGMVGLLVLYLGLDKLFGLITADASLAGYIMRYIRYSLLTFWAIFGAPWVFIKLKLAERR
jgi:membrane-associated phospholipid phosphatase